MMPKSNYDHMLEQARQLFLRYDQAAMVEKFYLQQDETYLYLPFTGLRYRIHRANGLVQWLDKTGQAHDAGFNEGMSLYDVLCYSKPDCHLSGQYAPINSVARSFHSSGLGESMFDRWAPIFARDSARLERACIALGGVKEGKGDIAYRLALFPFLPVRLQLWLADDEFPASLQLLWDTNTLDFVHYETTYYIAGHLLTRLRDLTEQTGV